MIRPNEINILEMAVQKLYYFGNGYGASVVKNQDSEGGLDGKWEVEVIKANPKFPSYEVCHDPVGIEIRIGWLDEVDVEQILKRIGALEVSK
jgi:hypothetical protein